MTDPRGNGRVIDSAGVGVVAGIARVGTRTKELTKALQPGQIAVINHADLDRVAAEGLVEARIAGVINVADSITGRYPNVGPLLLVAAGIALLDGVGPEAFERIVDGGVVTIDEDAVCINGDTVCRGNRQTIATLEARVQVAKETIGVELTRFAENTLEYMRAEQFLLLDSPEVPELDVEVQGRHVLIVVRGDQFKEDLRALNGYIRDINPVIFAVDGGADAVLAAGHRPHVIIGDFDSVSDATLGCGAQMIVHAYPNGKAPGGDRLGAVGVEYSTFALAGTSEDIAMLLAYEKGAELIVAVGTHVSLVDFLDKGRPGMASTFLTRLKVGPILVDAKGVNRLYRPTVRKRDLSLLVVTAMLSLILVLALLPPFQLFWRSLWITFREWRR
jgi:uncharacterized membrane-anchored protein